jgi:hypothetical protein
MRCEQISARLSLSFRYLTLIVFSVYCTAFSAHRVICQLNDCNHYFKSIFGQMSFHWKQCVLYEKNVASMRPGSRCSSLQTFWYSDGWTLTIIYGTRHPGRLDRSARRPTLRLPSHAAMPAMQRRLAMRKADRNISTNSPCLERPMHSRVKGDHHRGRDRYRYRDRGLLAYWGRAALTYLFCKNLRLNTLVFRVHFCAQRSYRPLISRTRYQWAHRGCNLADKIIQKCLFLTSY